MGPTLGDEQYRELLLLRTGLRRFLRQSESFARGAGLTPAQHQLLLAVRGHDDPAGPTIGDVAAYLLLRHHSAVELVDRTASAGLVERREDAHDEPRAVRLVLTAAGTAALERLSAVNLDELSRLADRFRPLWHGLGGDDEETAAGATGGQPPPPSRRVRVERVYDASPEGDPVLVDRLWPRGMRKDAAPFREWMREIAPSTELRQWYDHRAERFSEFASRYRDELDAPERADDLARLIERARSGSVTLLTATKAVERSAAVVLAGVVDARAVADRAVSPGSGRRR